VIIPRTQSKSVKKYVIRAKRRIGSGNRDTVAAKKIISGYYKAVYKEFRRQGKALLKFFEKKKVLERLDAYARSQNPQNYEKKKLSKKEREMIDRFIQGWERDVKPEQIEEVMMYWNEKAGNLGGNQALNTLGVNMAFHLKNADLLRELANRGARITGSISQNTLNRFREILYQSYMEQGLSPYEVKKRINGLFDDTYKGRAMTIARTETGVAQSIVAHKTYSKNGVNAKQWMALVDERTRPSHEYADGQIVGINEPFDVMGIAMMYPMDGNAPASEVISCRCSEVPIVSREIQESEAWTGE